MPKKKSLEEETGKVDKVLSKFKTHGIRKTNELFYAGAVVVTNRIGVKIDRVAWRKEPMWKRRLQNKNISFFARALCFDICDFLMLRVLIFIKT